MNNKEDCKKAATSLGMNFEKTGNWIGSPKGCLTSEWDGRQMFFNKHPIGLRHPDQAPICLQAGIAKTYQ